MNIPKDKKVMLRRTYPVESNEIGMGLNASSILSYCKEGFKSLDLLDLTWSQKPMYLIFNLFHMICSLFEALTNGETCKEWKIVTMFFSHLVAKSKSAVKPSESPLPSSKVSWLVSWMLETAIQAGPSNQSRRLVKCSTLPTILLNLLGPFGTKKLKQLHITIPHQPT